MGPKRGEFKGICNTCTHWGHLFWQCKDNKDAGSLSEDEGEEDDDDDGEVSQGDLGIDLESDEEDLGALGMDSEDEEGDDGELTDGERAKLFAQAEFEDFGEPISSPGTMGDSRQFIESICGDEFREQDRGQSREH